jgi:hypothetical protein
MRSLASKASICGNSGAGVRLSSTLSNRPVPKVAVGEKTGVGTPQARTARIVPRNWSADGSSVHCDGSGFAQKSCPLSGQAYMTTSRKSGGSRGARTNSSHSPMDADGPFAASSSCLRAIVGAPVCTLLVFAWFSTSIHSALVWLPDAEPQAVFASAPAPLKATIRNTGTERADQPVYAQLYQTGSETMAAVGRRWLWKRPAILPGQTVIEEIKVAFPKVEAETPFRLFWLDESGTTLATTDIRAFPDHLLAPLAVFAGQHPLGVFDPGARLKPLLRTEEIEFDEITADGHPEAFKGRLAIIAPLEHSSQLPDRFARDLTAAAKERGMALVWFQSPDKRRFGEPPVVQTERHGAALIVLAPASLAADLESSPRAQASLVWLAGLAVQPRRITLPGID